MWYGEVADNYVSPTGCVGLTERTRTARGPIRRGNRRVRAAVRRWAHWPIWRGNSKGARLGLWPPALVLSARHWAYTADALGMRAVYESSHLGGLMRATHTRGEGAKVASAYARCRRTCCARSPPWEFILSGPYPNIPQRKIWHPRNARGYRMRPRLSGASETRKPTSRTGQMELCEWRTLGVVVKWRIARRAGALLPMSLRLLGPRKASSFNIFWRNVTSGARSTQASGSRPNRHRAPLLDLRESAAG